MTTEKGDPFANSVTIAHAEECHQLTLPLPVSEQSVVSGE